MAKRGEKGAGRSNGLRPGLKHFYRPSWTVPAWDEFVLGHLTGTVVQVCPGNSRIGIARVDLSAEAPGMNVMGTFERLPLRDKCVDTVVCDPPYGVGFDKRVRLQRELFRIARKRLIFKAPWLCRGRGWALKVTMLLCSHSCQNIAVLSVMDRIEEPEDIFGSPSVHENDASNAHRNGR